MKRRTHPVKKGGISPYVRHGKRPYLYSDAYYKWRREMGWGKPGPTEAERNHGRTDRKEWRRAA